MVANDYYSSGSSAIGVPGSLRSIEDLTPTDFALVSNKVTRPSWMVTRFPVSIEEYRALTEAAAAADPQAMAVVDDPTVTQDSSITIADAQLAVDEVPEDAPLVPGGPALAPGIGHSFEGIPQTGYRPPDCTAAVGPNDVLVAANVHLSGYRKNGTLRFSWPGINSLFGGVLPSGAGAFDPKLAYDHYSQRWIVLAVARRDSPAGSWILLGASRGTDPIGPYWVWALDASVDGSNPSNNWADFPNLGFDTQAIYITLNQFRFGGGFSYSKLRILNKTEVYSGSALKWWDFWNMKNPDGSLAFTLQPAVHFQGLGGNPPAYLVNALWPGGSTLTLWQLRNPVAFWSGGTPILERFAVNCRSYDLPPDADQRGTATKIETNDSRLLNAVYQFAGGVKRLWATHTTKVTWSGDAAARAGVQWYEIDVPSRTVTQQGVFGAGGFYYYFPVIQTDINRNAYVAFGRSNSSEFASLRQTGRKVSDAPNTLQSSALAKAGESSYTGGRWGDYFGNGRDPADPGRAWLYGEFADAGNTWGTWAFSAKF